MRRIKKVIMAVSPNFYRKFDEERRKINNELNKRAGVNSKLSMPAFSELLYRHSQFPNLNLGGANDKRKKR